MLFLKNIVSIKLINFNPLSNWIVLKVWTNKEKEIAMGFLCKFSIILLLTGNNKKTIKDLSYIKIAA